MSERDKTSLSTHDDRERMMNEAAEHGAAGAYSLAELAETVELSAICAARWDGRTSLPAYKLTLLDGAYELWWRWPQRFLDPHEAITVLGYAMAHVVAELRTENERLRKALSQIEFTAAPGHTHESARIAVGDIRRQCNRVLRGES